MRAIDRLAAFVGTILIALLAAAVPAATQVALAELRGAVTDESGAALPGATITLTHVETGAVRAAVTSETGTYNLSALPVGTYKVTATLEGFKTIVQEELRLAVGESANASFTMNVATLEETVTVTGESPLVDTKHSDLSGRVEPSQVQNLPLNGRDWLSLVALVPGARGNPGNIQAGAAGGDMAKYQVDGVDVSGQCCGGSNQSYSQENISEFQVITNRFDAEHGRVGGAVINAVTKSGTNALRATGFGFFRDDAFDARNFYTGTVSPFHEEQMGLNGGGPILRDRMHFFGSYEYQQRAVTARTNTGIAQFDLDVPQDITRHMTTGRVDWQVNQQHRLFVRSSQFNWEQLNVGVGGTGGRATLSTGVSRPSKNTDLSVGETWVVTDRLVSDLRVGFSRIDNSLLPNEPVARLQFPSAIFGSPTNAPQWWKEYNIQANLALSYFLPAKMGDHAIKSGFQFFRPKFYGELPNALYGSYVFQRDPTDFADPSTYPPPTQYSTSLGDFSYTVTNPIYAGFVQDNWTVSSKLTLNLGLRYDIETGVTNTDFPNPVEPGERSTDSDNFQPRVGLAYDMFGGGRTVIRGGYGRYYDKVLLNITSNERRLATGQFVSVTIINPSFIDPLGGKTFEDYANDPSLPRSITMIGNDYATPRQDQVSLGIAHQFGDHAVQLDYVHSKGVNEPRSRNINFFEDPVTHLPLNPTSAGRPFPQYQSVTRYETSAKSKYDGLQIGFERRSMGTGRWRYRYQGSYILSWTYDDHDGNRFDGVNNPFNLADEYAYSNNDQRHRFTANLVTFVPWDIQLSAIVFVGSPQTIDIVTSLNPFNSGTGRWLNAQGDTLPRNGERATHWDKKFDLRLSKTVRVGRVGLQGIVEAFNVFNAWNRTNYNASFGSATYLQPSSSTNLFYQPRQMQLGFRITY